MSPLTIIGFTIIFLATTAGSALVYCFRGDISKRTNSILLGFAAGVMIAASVWSLLLPSIGEAEAMFGNFAWLPAATSFLLGGLFVMLGHVFPALLGFKGGKGILSGFTIAIMIDWRIALMILVVFAAVYLLTRYVSLASVLAAATFGAGFVIFHHDNILIALGGVGMAALAIFMHRSNIQRLIRGEERKTNLFSKGRKS